MKLQSLATFGAVVSQGSFAAAAEQVHLTPSAVSLQMKQLEAWFGQPLFDRSGRQVRPTPFALELARTVERSLGEIEALRDVAAHAPAGRVRLGITESAQTTLLPKAFGELQRRAPRVALQLHRGSTPDLLQSLNAGRIDVAVLIRPPTGGSSRLRWTALLKEALVLVVPSSLPAAPPAQILGSQPWIRLDRELVAGRLAAGYVHGLLPQHRALVDVPGIDAIVAMVGAGLGVSVLPRLRAEHLAGYPVREIELGRRAPVRQMAMVRRSAEADRRALDAVEEAFVLAAKALHR